MATVRGTNYTARDTTPGTGKISGVVTTLVKTTPYLVCYNGNSNLQLELQSLKFYVTAVSVGSTRVQFTTVTDAGNRYTSGGSALTIVNNTSGSPNVSNAIVTTGAITATAATGAERVLDHINFRGSIDAVEDSYTILFGLAAAIDGGASGSRAATVSDFVHAHAPVVLAPGQSFLVYEWSTSQSTGITLETTMTWIEK